jgi:hypothetical protein
MLDESGHRRLAFILHLYRLGIEQAQHPEPLNAAAILTFHDSVELVLALACEQRNLGPVRMDFDKYFEQLDKALAPGEVAERKAMLRLNSARVELKHRGTMPSPSDIGSFRDRVSTFLEVNVPLLFGIAVAEISFAHLVELPTAREAILQSERDRAEGRLEESLKNLAVAFGLVLRAHRISTETYTSFNFSALAQSVDEREVREMGRVLNKVVQAVQELEVEVRLLRYGIDTRRLEVFRRLAPRIRIAHAGQPMIGGSGIRNPTEQHVRFCHDFVIDSVLRIQQSQAATQPFART